jgi:glutathione peroxidase-family protein
MPMYMKLKFNSELYNQQLDTVGDITWNFAKFLVSGDGKTIKYFNPRVTPLKIVKDIEELLE